MTRAFALAALAVAACGARAAEPVERPRADGPAPADEARRNAYQLLLEGMSAYAGDLDARQRATATPANVTEALPPIPPLLPPVRPRGRGDALELADLALRRGDALDAAAQYRAWIDGRAPVTTGYANVRLAEAYVELGQIDRAVDALAQAVRSPDTEWYALAQLARLRVPAYGPLAVTQQLTLMVPARVDDIENYVIALVPPAAAGELLMSKAERIPRRADACGYAIAAVARGVDRVPPGLPDPCRLEVARAVHAARGELWLDERNPIRRMLARNEQLWRSTQAAAVEDPARWLGIADLYAHALETATRADDVALASRGAGRALVNVLRVAFLGSGLTDAERQRFDEIAAALAPDDRRRLSYILRAQPAQPGAR